MRRPRQPPKWRERGSLTHEEVALRADAATTGGLIELTTSPEFAAHIARKAAHRQRRQAGCWLVAVLALALGSYAAAAVLDPAALPLAIQPASLFFNTKPGVQDAPTGVPTGPSTANNATTEGGSEVPHAPYKPNAPADDPALKAAQAEADELRAANKLLAQDRETLKASLAVVRGEAREMQASLAVAERVTERLQREQRGWEQRALEQREQAAAVLGDSAAAPGHSASAIDSLVSWLRWLDGDVYWAALSGGLLLYGILPSLRRRARLRKLGAAHQAALASIAELTAQLETAQQTAARLEGELKAAAARATQAEGASILLQRDVSGLRDERASLAAQCKQLEADKGALAATAEGLRSRVAALLETGANLGGEVAALRARNQQLAADGQAHALDKEALREELSALREAADKQASCTPLAPPPAPDTPLSATDSSQALSELVGKQLLLARTPADDSDEEAVCSRIFWPDAELGEELSEQTRSGLAKIKRRMLRAGVGRPARRTPDAATPQTRQEYCEGLKAARERVAELQEANSSLEAQTEQVTASLQATMASLEAARRKAHARDQDVKHLELALAQCEEDCALAAEEAGLLRACAREALRLAEQAAGPGPQLERLRAALAAGQGAADEGGSDAEDGA